MSRFNDIVIHKDAGTVEIGAGFTWLEVYEYLVPRGLMLLAVAVPLSVPPVTCLVEVITSYYFDMA